MVRLGLALLMTLSAHVRVAGQEVYTLEPPANIERLLSDLRSGVKRAETVETLSTLDRAAPYLRTELLVAQGALLKRDLTRALSELDRRAAERNLGRAKAWLGARRIDLFAEVLSGCRDQDAVPLVDASWPLRVDLYNTMAAAFKIPPVPAQSRGFKDLDNFLHLAGDDVTVPVPRGGVVTTLVRAGRCRFDIYDRYGFVVAVRDEVIDLPKKQGAIGLWIGCSVFVNAPMTLQWAETSIIVCDGDLDLPKESSIRSSVIVVNGTIRCPSGPSLTQAALYATGDIEFPSRSAEGGLFHAGGMVSFKPGMPKPADRVRENQKELPLGIRFVSAADFGLEVAVQNGGVQIVGITPDSPFAKFGVADADVIVTVDGVRADSLPAFRRLLRKGILKESVTLGIRRGNDRLTRIVFLDGIPDSARPVAPPPRPVR